MNNESQSNITNTIHKQLQDLLNIWTDYSKKDNNSLFRQMEAQAQLYSILKIRNFLPSMSGMAITPDFGKILAETILDKKPDIIVEMGSGVSTIIAAYALEKNNNGKIYTLEHHDHFAGETKTLISKHSLNDFAELFYAPLKNYDIKGQSWLWYDNQGIINTLGKCKIDMLVIDGPPGNIQKHSRYPALPLLEPYLSDNITIVVDDTMRDEEKEIVDMWLKQFPGFVKKDIFSAKGTVLLYRK